MATAGHGRSHLDGGPQPMLTRATDPATQLDKLSDNVEMLVGQGRYLVAHIEKNEESITNTALALEKVTQMTTKTHFT